MLPIAHAVLKELGGGAGGGEGGGARGGGGGGGGDKQTEVSDSRGKDVSYGATSFKVKWERRRRRRRGGQGGAGPGRNAGGAEFLEGGAESESHLVRESQFGVDVEGSTSTTTEEEDGRTKKEESVEERGEEGRDAELDRGAIELNIEVSDKEDKHLTSAEDEIGDANREDSLTKSLSENRIEEDLTSSASGALTEREKGLKRLSKVLMLSIAYAANIGGTATLTGTGPNIVLGGTIET